MAQIYLHPQEKINIEIIKKIDKNTLFQIAEKHINKYSYFSSRNIAMNILEELDMQISQNIINTLIHRICRVTKIKRENGDIIKHNSKKWKNLKKKIN